MQYALTATAKTQLELLTASLAAAVTRHLRRHLWVLRLVDTTAAANLGLVAIPAHGEEAPVQDPRDALELLLERVAVAVLEHEGARAPVLVVAPRLRMQGRPACLTFTCP
eukprot:1192770-Pyramimonas_sp.AAC.3